MSSDKKISDEKWDRNKGRRTLYFSADEILTLEKIADQEGISDTELIKRAVRDLVAGRLVRKEALDAYKDIVDRLTASGRSTSQVPTFGEENDGERKKKVG